MFELTPKKKKKASRVIIGSGLAIFIIGLVAGLFSYKWGLVIFVFSLVIAGYVQIAVPAPEDNPDISDEK